jgi:hypothetical protein
VNVEGSDFKAEDGGFESFFRITAGALDIPFVHG